MKSRYPIFLAVLLGTCSLSVLACGSENVAMPPSTPTSDFTLHGDGTSTHNTTGLMWMRCGLGQVWNDPSCDGGFTNYTWRSALDAVVEFNAPGGFNGEAGYAGYTDWRLPNVKELDSILEHRCSNPAINGTVFPNTSSDFTWSSTTNVAAGANSWAVNFGSPLIAHGSKNSSLVVRLVRGGH